MKARRSVPKIQLPLSREMTTLLNRLPSQNIISEIDPLSCPIHDFMLFLDELVQKEVSLRLVEVLYVFLQFESSKSGRKNLFCEKTNDDVEAPVF